MMSGTLGVILRRLSENETKNRQDTQQVPTSGKRKTSQSKKKGQNTAKNADPKPR